MRTILTAFLVGGLLTASASGAATRQRTDFDGDGRDDVAVYHRDGGIWYIQRSSNGTLWKVPWGDRHGTPVPGDYDGDRVTDIAIFNRPTGQWQIRLSTTGGGMVRTLGDPDALPAPGDFDGDGITDPAVFYRTSGEWQYRESSTGVKRSVLWGGPGTRPAAADYDGDGKTDFANYLPATGAWYIRSSRTGQLREEHFGGNTARPVPGFYDGDDRADVALYYPKAGQWKILESTTGQIRATGFGNLAAPATPGDFDGDGRTDVAVYHPPRGRWYIQQSGNGQLRIQNWGALVARPVQAYAQGALEDIRVHSHGDSITFGMGSYLNGPASGYPVLLEEYLEGGFGGDIVSLNYGVPGETTDSGLNRLSWDLAFSNADILLIMEGTNDHFFNHPYDQIESNLRAMVVEGLARGKFVVLATIPPVIPSQRYDQQQRIIGFNPRIYNIARDYNIPVAPVYEFITSVAGWEYLLMDPSTGNHPNDTGYAFVRAAFYAALQPYLEAAEIN